MCGFAGFYQPTAAVGEIQAAALAKRMIAPIMHRGPDDAGIHVEMDGAFGLGFRRLAIRDLSSAGHQPMVSGSGRYVIAFNGEIYNADSLRHALEAKGVRFRGRSDTEVLLESFDEVGLDATLDGLIGMFAIALFDCNRRQLILARDRLGIKPLYWSNKAGRFLFASQLKCFRGHNNFDAVIDPDILQSYLRFGYVPGPHAIFEHCHKLEPGCYLTIGEDLDPRLTRYWDLQAIARVSQQSPLQLHEEEAAQQFHDLALDAVQKRMIADVPLGAFLSGGIDSSTVVALMQANSGKRVKTFSIGFEDDEFNEAPFARAVAEHLGTEHYDMILSPKMALAAVPELPAWFDEPFADNSAIPTLLLSEMTAQHVTVALSGDGGDELFAGYNRYSEVLQLVQRRDALPGLVRGMAASGLRAASPLMDMACDTWPLLEASLRPSYRTRKLADLMDRNPGWMMRHVIGHHQAPADLVKTGREPINPIWLQASGTNDHSVVSQLQLIDQSTYLPDDILAKVDRASMAASLEARVPLLDHRLVEFSWQLPASMRSGLKPRKKLLRSVLERYVPASLIDRPKKGFSVPVHAWLRGPLRDWACDLLDQRTLRETGLIDPARAEALLSQHLSGRADWRYPLWNLLMFEAWRRHWLEGEPAKTLSG